MRRHAAQTAALLLLLLVTASSNGAAQASSSSSSSSISSSSSSSSAAFSSTGAACSDAEYTGTCWYQVTCRLCLGRSGCAVEASTGDCVSAADVDSALVGTSYFLAGDAQYCGSSDAACDACMSSGDDSTVCRGSGGCICSSACEQIPASATTCDGDVGKSSQLVLLAASALFFAVLLLVSFKFNTGLGGVIGYLCVEFWRRWRRRQWLRSRQQRNGGDGSGDLQRQSMPPLHLLDGSTAVEGKALTLDGWWKHVSAQEQRFGGVALETCYVQMPRDETDAVSSAPTARSTPTDSLPTWDRVGRSTSDSV